MRHHGSLLTRIMQSFAISPEQGAITQLFAASAPDAKLLSGKVRFRFTIRPRMTQLCLVSRALRKRGGTVRLCARRCLGEKDVGLV